MMAELIVEVCKIDKVERHPNADRLDIATVKGWNCIVGRHEFKEGDLCIYIPVDAVLPDALENVLFSNTQVKLKKHRVRTIKLRGVVSQGLVISPAKVNEYTMATKGAVFFGSGKIAETYDCKDVLGITKYEPPAKGIPMELNNSRRALIHRHPSFRKYTDINHLKNFPTMLQDEYVVITEKIHGTNFRCGWLPYKPRTIFEKLKKIILGFFGLDKKWEFVYGSHNVQLQDGSKKQYYETNVYAKIVKQLNLKELLGYTKGFIFYGEIFGDGIQRGYTYGAKPGDIDIRWFDIFDVDEQRYLSWDDLWTVSDFLNLELVPVLDAGYFRELNVDKHMCGRSKVAKEQRHREGIVIRSVNEFNGHGGRSILKLINPDYLLLKDNSDWH
jgi:RNA ligase (TIGR02306 family)